MMGICAAVLFSATFLANGHYSVPFVQFIGSYSDEAASPEASAKVAMADGAGQPVAGTEFQIAGERGGRVFTGAEEQTADAAIAAKGDRVANGYAPVDRNRLAYAAGAKPVASHPSPERFLAPAHRAESARLSAALSASRADKIAKLLAPAGKRPDTAAIRSLASAVGADIAGAMPHPSRRPDIRLASLTTTEDANEPLAQRFANSIPVPTARPQPPTRAVEKLASIASEAEGEAPLAPALNSQETLADLPQEAPVPTARPAHRAAAPATQSSRRANTALAYAPASGATDDSDGGGLLGGLGKLFSGGGGHSHLPGVGSGIAVYDISTATVYMPNGAKLEAHSGLGHMQDNPRYVHAKNKGPTPPNVYNLVMRESRFHGVEAIRLLPADGKKKFNRDGLLAHTYMYRNGDSSQSNGCVVFKDYKRFLAAFKKGKVKRMIVVPNMAKLPTYTASL